MSASLIVIGLLFVLFVLALEGSLRSNSTISSPAISNSAVFCFLFLILSFCLAHNWERHVNCGHGVSTIWHPWDIMLCPFHSQRQHSPQASVFPELAISPGFWKSILAICYYWFWSIWVGLLQTSYTTLTCRVPKQMSDKSGQHTKVNPSRMRNRTSLNDWFSSSRHQEILMCIAGLKCQGLCKGWRMYANTRKTGTKRFCITSAKI